MFIVATYCEHKSCLQQFYGTNLVKVLNKAKSYSDPDNRIAIEKVGQTIQFTFVMKEKEHVEKIEMTGNYLGKICVLFNDLGRWTSGGHRTEFVIFDTAHPEFAIQGSGGKVE